MSTRASTKQVVLFLCTGNSARSQMAEAILRHLAGERFVAQSAGVDPKPVHPLTRQVLAEAGIPAEDLRSKSVREFMGKERVHHAIVVCESARAQCPQIFPFAGRTHYWPFDDPAAATGTPEQQLEVFRAVRTEIEQRIRAWLAELDG